MNDNEFKKVLKKLYLPPPDSHKGQNGRLLIIGGSHLFHAASLWALKVASRIVDLVHYSSVKENNEIVMRVKSEFRNGIVVQRKDIEEYIEEDDCILIGPGMVRAEKSKINNSAFAAPPAKPMATHGKASTDKQMTNIKDIEKIKNEGTETYFLTNYLLRKYPHKKWVIDAGALQMTEPEWIPEGAILTPHTREMESLIIKIKNEKIKKEIEKSKTKEQITIFAREYNCTVLLKGRTDYIVSGNKAIEITGGNAGMTKGGTGDVLAGLVAALFCKNEAYSCAVAGSYINKKAGDWLFKKTGYWFNASDLADQIPQTMKRLLLS
ncbi:hypothetical protein A3D05_02090 [Candidatus Gottesmanbacteria bacterium RIFCSPHIGHO2_02_FULL_40_24]|nr:MAG: hypothetical protein A3D05_02090 [Candidatus Gottesmanbacteria bacterium RIFCSPHIGHO2_02_FULL_40_24]OGG22811.1 MAG: hypothetical protein A3B48_05475 [Candidatus Gottesmanbacteria bacterium RIFCSPLOWO2_01_FULL_40_10]OGG31860.1 MAG: hypothetical protein A3I80_02430 [Candidatus Gottesmanbacteria bacterium RIFCSPLOWO2_02_FULL_40_10]